MTFKTLLLSLALMMVATAATAQLEVVPECAAAGTNFGMRTTTADGDQTAMFVRADSSNGFAAAGEGVVRLAFWFNPGDMFIRHGRVHFISTSLPGTGTDGVQVPFRVIFARNNFTDERKVAINCRVNCADAPNGTCPSAATTRLNLGTVPDFSLLQVEWAQNSGPGIFDGVCRISVLDGPGAGQSAQANITNNRYSISAVDMGFKGGVFIDPQSAGHHCFDEFSSFRTLAP